MRIVRASLVALLFTLCSSRAGAQGTHDVRSGFYGSGGIGYGYGTCSGDCPSSNEAGVGYYLALGFTLNQHLRLGAEWQLWTKTQNGGKLDVNYVLASLSYYPSAASAFWIKVNAGYTDFTVRFAGVPASVSSGGGAAGIGLGYDWQPVPGNFVIIPFAEYNAQLSSSSGEPKGNVLLIGLGVGFKH